MRIGGNRMTRVEAEVVVIRTKVNRLVSRKGNKNNKRKGNSQATRDTR